MTDRLPVEELSANWSCLRVPDWRAIPGYEGWYEVNELGEVRALDRLVSSHSRRGKPFTALYKAKPMYPSESGNGYRTVLASQNGIKKTHRVNILVCTVFHGPRPDASYEAAHKNGVSTDDRADNLYWATTRQQLEDKRRHGTYQEGEKASNTRLTANQVQQIRASNKIDRVLAEEFGVARSTIQAARRGQTWTSLEDK